MAHQQPRGRVWRDDERGGIAVMVGLFGLLFATLVWGVIAVAGRHMTAQRGQQAADSLALAGAAMVLEQGSEGDVVRNWDQLVQRVGRPNAGGQRFSARSRVIHIREPDRERRVVEVRVVSTHESALGTARYEAISYAFVNEKLYSDEWPVVMLLLDATGSMANSRSGRNRRSRASGSSGNLWERLKKVVKAYLARGLPARTGVLAFNQYGVSWVAPGAGSGGGHVAHFPERPRSIIKWFKKYSPCRKAVGKGESDEQLCQRAMTFGDGSAECGHQEPRLFSSARTNDGCNYRRKIRCATQAQAILSAIHYIVPDNATNVKLPLEQATKMLAPYDKTPKRVVVISDGIPTSGGAILPDWVPVLGGPSDEQAAIEAGETLRELPDEGAYLFAIETAHSAQKTQFLINLAGGPIVGEKKYGNVGCGKDGAQEHPFYKNTSSMKDVEASLNKLAQAVCTFGPLVSGDDEPVAVYLQTPGGDQRLSEGADYILCSGWVQLKTDKCKEVGQNSGYRVMIRWGRPRLIKEPNAT